MCNALTEAMSSAGIGAVLGVILSFVVEWWPRWKLDEEDQQAIPARTKRLILLGLCVGIGLGMLGLAWALGCTDKPTRETVWNALVAAGAAFSASQVAHLRSLPAGERTKA